MHTVLTITLTLLFSSALASVFSPVLRGHPPPPVGNGDDDDNATLMYFIQDLDHFDPDETGTWTQRYYVNKESFDTTNKNVVFLQIGGEQEISINWSLYGTWVDMGKKYGALMFQLEHRFYGGSQPFNDTSTEHLKYLTSAQALADTANFIEAMNDAYELPEGVKWIVFGGSYSGSLAAWMRLKYPDLVHGAVASSAPVQAKLDLIEYFLVTINDMASISYKCVENVKTAMERIDKAIAEPEEAFTVTELLNLCTSVEGLDLDHLDVQSFHNRLSQIFSAAAQTNGLASPSVADVCASMVAAETEDEMLIGLAETVELRYGTSCVPNDYLDTVKGLSYNIAPYDSRVWTYQTCAEFGWFQTTDWANVFGAGAPLKYYTDICVDIFGPEFNETFIANQVQLTNENYGGININVSNVVFVHGSFDPWNLMGVKQPVNPGSSSILIEGTSHCADMYDIYPELPQLISAKKEIDRLVGVWLGVDSNH